VEKGLRGACSSELTDGVVAFARPYHWAFPLLFLSEPVVWADCASSCTWPHHHGTRSSSARQKERRKEVGMDHGCTPPRGRRTRACSSDTTEATSVPVRFFIITARYCKHCIRTSCSVTLFRGALEPDGGCC
jgi:hypothetical protein